MSNNAEADLHTLLDSLTDGEHVKTTWASGPLTITVEGPVTINETLWCHRPIRWENGDINPTLTSLGVTRDEEVTATRDDDEELIALIDSLKDGQEVTAELGNREGSMSITGKVRTDGAFLEVYGYDSCVLRRHRGVLSPFLRSVTVRRTAVKRWEREGDE